MKKITNDIEDCINVTNLIIIYLGREAASKKWQLLIWAAFCHLSEKLCVLAKRKNVFCCF
jgi:hypothetical protein